MTGVGVTGLEGERRLNDFWGSTRDTNEGLYLVGVVGRGIRDSEDEEWEVGAPEEQW